MRPLIDGDVLRYEVGFMAHIKDAEGNEGLLDFDRVSYLLDERIRVICEEVNATEDPVIYLTADKKLADQLNRDLVRQGEEPQPFKPNFREALAVSKGYKATRKKDKPYHYWNLTAYILATYECRIANGMEADDLMCMDQYEAAGIGEDTVICSRDKDLRMCPGWHYSWECGKQPSIGPVNVPHNSAGWLEKKPDGKVIGYGDKFFYYQMLVGDVVDNIPGCPGMGKVKAFKLLDPIEDRRALYDAVKELYQEAKGDDWLEYFKEQASLLWMVRELDEDGNPVMFSPPKG